MEQRRTSAFPLDVIVVGAGLGGLGAAIALSLAGHHVLVLESASTIGEIGAGIQILPNASRILLDLWDMRSLLLPHCTMPRQLNMITWKGKVISSMDFHKTSLKHGGAPFWDFHRAGLHSALLERARQLGTVVRTDARVEDLKFDSPRGKCTVLVKNGEERLVADLVIGADGIASNTREILLGRKDPPKPTGDLAYRLLLKTEEMLKDPELRGFVEDPQVNYWLGPDCHAVNYVLRGGKQFNMVLLVPDDIPDGGATTVEGNVDEMRALYAAWDPRIPKLLKLCESVHKWKLCIRPDSDEVDWSHPSGTFVLLGDSVHATLPYLASGAGMALEDGAVLGECLSRIKSKSDVLRALDVYERCRKQRTSRVVQRGNLQQYLYHLHDGPEQEERDRIMRMDPPPAGEALAWRDQELAPWLFGYEVTSDVQRGWNEIEREAVRSKEQEGGGPTTAGVQPTAVRSSL